MAFNFDVDTQDVLERRKPLTGADLGMTGGMVVQPGERVRPLNMQDVLNIRDQMQPQEIQLANFDPVQVSSAQYDFIVNHLAGIKDKAEMEAEEIRIASALSYSRNLGLPFQYTLQNLDQIALEWNGIKYSPTATNFRSITDSFKLGTLRNQRGALGTRAMNAASPEELSQILAESTQLSQQMAALQDSVPRPWYIDLLKMGAENIPYIAEPAMEGGIGYMSGRLGLETAARLGGMAVTSSPLQQIGQISLQATKIGGRLNLPLATAITAYSIYKSFQRNKEINQGNLFLDLLEAGVPADTARPIADVAGSINSAIEMIGGVDSSWLKAAGIDVDTVASRLLSRMVIRGRLAELGTFAARWGAEAFTEGTEEVFQGIVEGIASDYAYALSGIRNPDAENQESWIKEAADNFAGGFAVSLLLGLPAVAISTHADFQTVKDLRNLSLTVRSKESYDELAAAMRPEDINEADWKTVTDTQFERGKEKGFNAFREAVSREDIDTTLTDLSEGEDVADDDSVDGENITGETSVDRLADGRLYGYETGEARRLPRAFGQAHTFTYGSPRTGSTYGAVTYRTDREGNLTITNVRTRDGFQNIREEIVSDFISRFPDMNIAWETNSNEEADIRTRLINSNPRGAEYGLNYGTSPSSNADIQAVRTRIGNLFSEDDAVNSALSEVVELIGTQEGLTGSQWLDRYIPEFRRWTAAEQAEADAGLSEGYHRTGASEFYDIADGVKAVVYAGEYANPTTFMHEMTHVLRRIGNNGAEFRTIFDRVRNDVEFQRFVENSPSIHNKDLSSLFNSDKWTAADDEFFAELAEAYWASGRTGNAALRGFFERIKRAFRNVYRAIRGTGKLNDEVRDYYDRLFGMSPSNPSAVQSQNRAAESSETSLQESAPAIEQETRDERAVETAEGEMLESPAMPGAEIVRQSAVETDSDIATAKPAEPGRNTIEGWTSLRFTEAFNSITDNPSIREYLNSIPVSLHKAAGLVKVSEGYPSATSSYELDPRYSNLSEEDAAKMQRNADEYEAAVQKHDERQRDIIADGTVALDYTVNGKTYHMDAAAVDGLGMFTPVEYIEEAGLQDNPVRLSINADNVRVEGLEQPDPNVLWKDIPDRTLIMEEEEFADEYDPYESGLDEDGNPLFQTVEDITATGEWQETEVRLRANAANFDEAGRPLAPNGQLSKLPYREWVTVRTPSFMTWFGDWMNDPENASKIVDDNGEPLVVYHGTASEFSVFDRNYLGSSTEAKSARIGFFFTNNQRTAEGYGNYASGNEARQLYKRVLELEKQGRWEEANQLELRVEELALQKSNGIVMPAFLNIKNPYVVDADGASFKETGRIFSEFEPDKYDGMAVYSLNDNIDDDYAADHYIALRPNQIKSINNRGTFDNGSPDIYYQTVYHGSPYTFSKFSTDHMGEGAGAQDYGWGIYFSDVEEYARAYADRARTAEDIAEDIERYSSMLERANADLDEARAERTALDNPEYWEANESYQKALNEGVASAPFAITRNRYAGYSNEEYASVVRDRIISEADRKVRIAENSINDIQKRLDDARNAIPQTRNFYIVELPDNAKWLDFNSQIPRSVVNSVVRIPVIKRAIIDNWGSLEDYRNSMFSSTAGGFYNDLAMLFGSDKEASLALNRIGITGFRYPANGIAEREGTGPYNYVVFNPADAAIVNHTLYQTMTGEEQEAFVEKATEYALDNPDILYQFMDTGTHDALSDYMRELMRLAAQFTDYDDYYDMAAWVIYEGDENTTQEQIDSYILEAWNKQKNPEAAGSDDPAKNPTLASPDFSATTEEMKDEEFSRIISTDEGFNEWLEAIQIAVRDPRTENERALYEIFATSNIVAPLVSNLVFPSKRWVGVRQGGYTGTALNEEKHSKAIASAKGILRANAAFYRDLYAKATETDFWQSLYDDSIPAELEDISLADLKNISISERRRIAEGIKDENLKKSILAGTDTYNSPELTRLIKKQEEAIEEARVEVRRLDEERESIIKKYNKTSGEKQLLWRETARLQAEIDNARERLSRISERIANASQNEFGEAGTISQKTIDQQASIAKQITALVRQQDSYLRQLRRESISQAISETREIERSRADKRVAATRERGEQARKDQYQKDLERMSAIRKDRDKKLRELKEYYQERERFQRVRNHKMRLANSIMREPSSGVNWTQAEKIRAIQAVFDPNFRKSIRIDGKTWDINLLKQMLRGEVERDPVVFDSLKPEQLDKLSRKSLDEMTISELEDMASAISQLREDGIKERKAITSAERKRIASYRNQVLGVVMANPRYKDEPLPGTREDRELEKPLRKKLSSIYYGTANMSRRTQDMEGGKKGVIWQLLVGMKRDAQTERDRMILQRMEPINAFIKEHGIDRSRFYEYFQLSVDGKTKELRYSDLVYLYLSQNNQRNRDAEAYGMFVTQSEKERIRNEVFKEIPYEGSRFYRERTEESNRRIAELGDRRYEEALQQAEAIIKDESRRDLFELVRLVEADFNSDLFDRLREAEAKTYNIVVEKEDYYLPINRTDFAGSEPGEMVKQDLLNLIPENGTIQKGFLESRQTISPYRQKPINTDFFGVWEKSVWAQEHALANMDYIRLLKGVFQNYGSKELQNAITNTFGKATMDAIDTQINQIANPDSYKKFRNNDESRILNFFRGSLYSSYLGFRLPSLVTQLITSPAPFLGAVQNPLRLAQGYFAVISHPLEVWEEIKRLSPFMATRSMNPTLEWIQEEASRGDTPKLQRAISKFNSVGMMGLELVDRYAVAGGWWAIYQQERAKLLTEGNLQTEAEIEKAAAKVADGFVQETQPQSDITELSPLFQNRSAALQIITQFQTSLNVVWQNITRDIPNAFRNKQYAKAIGMITGYVMSGLILYAVQEGFEDDDEDDEGIALWRRLLYAATTQPVSGIPLISDYVDALVEKITTGDTSGVYSSPVFPATDRIFKAIINIASKNWGKAAEQISDSLLLFSGLPYSLIRDLGEMFDVEDGEIDIHPEVLIGRDPE